MSDRNHSPAESFCSFRDSFSPLASSWAMPPTRQSNLCIDSPFLPVDYRWATGPDGP